MRRAMWLGALMTLCSAALAAPWAKYVAPDKSFSIHYPQGWKIKTDGSVMEITNPAANEELLLIALPLELACSARQHAEKMLGTLKDQRPDLQADNWALGNGGATATCEVTYTEKGEAFRGDVLVIKDLEQAAWFSYSAPASGYSRARAAALLQGMVESISPGEGSQAPSAALPPPLEGPARAFLFVLEFALEAPFTAGQERRILDELEAGWSREPAERLKPYEAYPRYVQAIMGLDQEQLSATRQRMEHTIREWLKTADKHDPAVAIIDRQLAEKGKALVGGTPPLTVMAARAYSELLAYAELLQCEPAVTADQLDSGIVTQMQEQLVQTWPKLSREQREQVRATPAVWFVLRSVMEQGSQTDREKARALLDRLAVAQQTTATQATPAKPAASFGGPEPMSMVAHTALLQIQQQTFNTYLWAHGCKSTMLGY